MLNYFKKKHPYQLKLFNINKIYMCGLVAVTFIFFNLLFMPIFIIGDSMNPTLVNNQWVLISRYTAVKRFDIVVINERTDNKKSKSIIKRVIGMPGDIIIIANGNLYINNERYDEPYLIQDNIKKFKNYSTLVEVPKNHIFVLGDNRDVSRDSREVGSFEISDILGVMIMS